MTFRTFAQQRLFLLALAMALATVGVACATVLRATASLRAFAWRADIMPPGEATSMLDRDDRPVFWFGEVERTSVPLPEIAPTLVRAVLAAEDRRFYRHRGVDVVAVARAAWRNIRAGRVVQGASSLTQQLARALLDDRARTFGRKWRELIVALELERRFSKAEILEAYLNRVFFGNGCYGVAAAAKGYFGKGPSELDVAEAATLAALIPAPSTLSNAASASRLRARRNRVLRQMHGAGWLSPAELEGARDARLTARLPATDTEERSPTTGSRSAWSSTSAARFALTVSAR